MNNKETLQNNNNRLAKNNLNLASVLETINNLPEAGGGEGAIGQKYIYLIKDGVVQVENTGEYSYKMTNGDAEVSVIEQDGYLGLCSKCWSDGTFTFANTFDLKSYSNIHIDFAYPSASSPYAYRNATSILHVGSMSTYNTLFNNGATTQRKTVVVQIPDGSEEDTITFVCSNLGDDSTYTKYPFRLYNLYIENPDIQVQDKEIEITENGVYNITKDEDYIALNSVEVTVDVEPNLQDKVVEITENGTQLITADEGYDGLNNVEVVTNVASSGADFKITDGSYLFQYGHRMENLNDLIPFFDLTKAEYMFHNCKATSLDLRRVDVSKVTDMTYILAENSSLMTLDVSNWNTSNVTKMANLFRNTCFVTTIDLSKWDTSNVTDMSYMFRGFTGVTTLDLSNFDTSKVTNMSAMFYDCSKLTMLDIRNFDFTKVSKYNAMFKDIPANCEIIVKDETAKNWVLAIRSDLTNVKTVAELGE